MPSRKITVRVPRGRRGAAAGLLAGAVVVAALAGCDVKQGNEDLVAGKQMFVAKCGSCHVLQHASFVFAGVLIWWCAIEPQRARLRGELWKIPYIFASRMVSMFLGVGFLVSRHPLYHDYYGNRPRAHGISPLADTQLAGGLMMTLDMVIIAGSLIFFFWRASQDADRDEEAERSEAERAARAAAATPAT